MDVRTNVPHMEKTWTLEHGTIQLGLVANYCEETDMTFITRHTYVDGHLQSMKVVGFHFGEPNEDTFKTRPYRSLEATFEL